MTAQAMTFRLKDAVAHGSSLRASGQLMEAQQVFQQIADQLPSHPAGWLGLGEVLLDQFKVAEAIVAFEQAMRIQGASASLHHALGAAKALIGRLLESEAHYQEALKLKPRCAEYYFHYSRLRMFTTEDGLHQRIDRLLAQGDLSDGQRCHLHFAAGKIHDDLGEFDKAFDHFWLGNECKQVRYDRDRWETVVDQTRNAFDANLLKALVSRKRAKVDSSPMIVFIVGMPRSGTSLVEQILASHADVFGAGELPDLNLISLKLGELAGTGSDYPDAIRVVDSSVLDALGERYCQRVEATVPAPRKVYCDKTPSNYFFIGLMHGLFSNVRVIHCRRDPLDTALSCYATNFKQGQNFSYSLDGIVHQFQVYQRLMRHWGSVATIPILHMDYEHLVQNQEEATREMLGFLGVPWDDACLAFERTQRVVATASAWQVRQPIYRSSVGRWKNYAKHLEPLRAQLVDQPSESSAAYRFDDAEQMPAPADVRVPASADLNAPSDGI